MLNHALRIIGTSLLIGVCSLFAALLFGVIGTIIGGMLNVPLHLGYWDGYEVTGGIAFIVGHAGALLLGQLGLSVRRAKLQSWMVFAASVSAVCISGVSMMALRYFSQRYAPIASNELIVEYFIGSVVLIPAILLSAIYLVHRFVHRLIKR